jgi:galactonate dehydratase
MMPDIKYAGGPDEMIEIEKFFLKNNVEFSPHNPTGPISHLQTLHVCASVTKDALMEHQFEETSYFQKLLNNSPPKIVNGKSLIDIKISGLGNSIDRNILKKLN